MGDDVVGRPFVVGGFFCCVHFEWRVEWFWRWGLFLGFFVRRYLGFDQVFRAPGLRGPHVGGCRYRGLEEGGGVGVEGGGSWLGVEDVVVLICPAYGVASFGCCGVGFGSGLAGWIGWP